MKTTVSPMIRNLEELAAHVGANEATPRSIDRRVYKDTDCGPSVSFLYQTAPAHETSHLAEVRADETGRIYLSKLTPPDLEVAKFLGFDNGRDCYPGEVIPADSPFASLASFAEACEEFSAPNQKERIFSVSSCRGCVRVRVNVKHPAKIAYVHSGRDVPPELAGVPCVGIQIGSIVEGSDAEIYAALLYFPFTEADFDACLEGVNSEACAAWDAANSDEQQRRDEKNGLYGGREDDAN